MEAVKDEEVGGLGVTTGGVEGAAGEGGTRMEVFIVTR